MIADSPHTTGRRPSRMEQFNSGAPFHYASKGNPI
jgi:hypothetical protein